MRTVLLALIFFVLPEVSSAQEASITPQQELMAAPFVLKHEDTFALGKLRFAPTYRLSQTADTWRVPESGQNVTKNELELRGYVSDHPLLKFGFSLFVQRNRHDEQRAFANTSRFGHDADENKGMLHFTYQFQ